MEITYKDKIIKAQKGTKIKEVLKEEIETSKYNIMGALVNNEYQNIEYELKEDAHIKLLEEHLFLLWEWHFQKFIQKHY